MDPVILWLLLPLVQGDRPDAPVEDDDEYAPSVDVLDTPRKVMPVPFGHIFREGIDDPNSDVRQPLDFLELSLKTPRTRAETQRLLKETPPERIIKVNKKKYEIFRDDLDDKIVVNPSPPKRDNTPVWFDFEAIHNQRMIHPYRPVPLPERNPTDIRKRMEIVDSPAMLEILDSNRKIKWTNCTEFSKGSSSFHPKDIVDIPWTPFYVWSTRRKSAAVVHMFTYPTKRIVREYKSLYSRYLNKSLDWEQPKLVLNESIEMLLIADPKDRRGLFHSVPRRPLPTDPKIQKLVHFTVPRIRLKIVDPYLAVMHCDEYFAAIMASPGNEPFTDHERTEEARILNFTGIGYPVERDLEADLFSKGIMPKSQVVKYIKALNVDSLRVDID